MTWHNLGSALIQFLLHFPQYIFLNFLYKTTRLLQVSQNAFLPSPFFFWLRAYSSVVWYRIGQCQPSGTTLQMKQVFNANGELILPGHSNSSNTFMFSAAWVPMILHLLIEVIVLSAQKRFGDTKMEWKMSLKPHNGITFNHNHIGISWWSVEIDIL